VNGTHRSGEDLVLELPVPQLPLPPCAEGEHAPRPGHRDRVPSARAHLIHTNDINETTLAADWDSASCLLIVSPDLSVIQSVRTAPWLWPNRQPWSRRLVSAAVRAVP
jgi:hypothetical protein